MSLLPVKMGVNLNAVFDWEGNKADNFATITINSTGMGNCEHDQLLVPVNVHVFVTIYNLQCFFTCTCDYL